MLHNLVHRFRQSVDRLLHRQGALTWPDWTTNRATIDQRRPRPSPWDDDAAHRSLGRLAPVRVRHTPVRRDRG